MKVLMVEPGYAPYEKELNGLAEMQAAVGGRIQPIYPFEEKVGIVCNEEGLINGMDFNRSVPGGYQGVFGPFFVCGLGDEDFCSLTPEQIKTYKKMFHKAELLAAAGKDGLVTLPVEPKVKAEQAPDKPQKKHEQDPER